MAQPETFEPIGPASGPTAGTLESIPAETSASTSSVGPASSTGLASSVSTVAAASGLDASRGALALPASVGNVNVQWTPAHFAP